MYQGTRMYNYFFRCYGGTEKRVWTQHSSKLIMSRIADDRVSREKAGLS